MHMKPEELIRMCFHDEVMNLNKYRLPNGEFARSPNGGFKHLTPAYHSVIVSHNGIIRIGGIEASFKVDYPIQSVIDVEMAFVPKNMSLEMTYTDFENDGDNDGNDDLSLEVKLFRTEEEYFQNSTVRDSIITYEQNTKAYEFFKFLSEYISDMYKMKG